MEILYKKDSKGDLLEWSAKVKQSVSGVSIQITYGVYNGNLINSSRDNIQGKNLGKSNETTPYTQAEADVISLYNKKKREGYKSLKDLNYKPDSNDLFGEQDLTLFLKANLKFDTRDGDGNVKPMKAQQYYRSKKNYIDDTGKPWDDRKYYFLLNPEVVKTPKDIIIKFPCLIQPKINGVRATISLDEFDNVQILSKEGLKYEISHIEDVFNLNRDMFYYTDKDGNPAQYVFDGELYIEGEKLQVITSAVKKFNINTPRVIFIAFDLAIPNMTNIARVIKLKELLQFSTYTLSCPIQVITTHKIGNDGFVQKYTDAYIREGYEGSIMRNPLGLYAFGKRPMDMVKLKRVIDEEFTIVDIVPQDKNPSLGLYVCVTKEGREFKVTPRGDEDFKELLLLQKHLYLNKQLTCTFYEYTEDLIPFHVIDNLIRDYE